MTQTLKQEHDEQYSVEDDQIAHLAGVFDTAGSVTLRVIKDSDYRLGYTVRPMLRLLRSNEKDPVLGKLLEYCDQNGVRYTVSEKSHGADRDSTSIEWVVKDPDSIERFLTPMMDYLVTNFLQAQIMLDDALPAIRNGEHRDKDGFYRLIGVADDLRELNASPRDAKYTQEFFREELSISE